MQTVNLEIAQAKLPELLRNLSSDEDLLITDGGQPLAKVTKTTLAGARPEVFGWCKGMFQYQDGWDGPEEDFKAYSESWTPTASPGAGEIRMCRVCTRLARAFC